MGEKCLVPLILFGSVLLTGCITSSDEGGSAGGGGSDNRINLSVTELTLHEFQNIDSQYLTAGDNPVVAIKSFSSYTALVEPKLTTLLDLNDKLEKTTGFTYARSYPLNPFSGLAGLIESVSYDVGDNISLAGAAVSSMLSYDLATMFPEGATYYAATRTVTTASYQGNTAQTTPVFLLNSIAFDFLTQQGVIK